MSSENQETPNEKNGAGDTERRPPGSLWQKAKTNERFMSRLRQSLEAKRRGERPVPATELIETARSIRVGD
jgi:hypothetical protein